MNDSLYIFVIIVISLLGFLILSLILTDFFGYKMFRVRNDRNPRFKYLSLKDYPGLHQENVSTISTEKKAKLNGGIFTYDFKKYHGVIIFYHGFLSGYINYLHVINYFASKGFIVVAFDMYGNLTSEGKNMKGLAQGDKDNKVIIEFVKNSPRLNQYPIYVVGHSWGGHLALTSLLHEDKAIKKAVAFSPYNSNVDSAYTLSKYLKLIAPFIYLLNLIKFGYQSTYSGVSALKYTKSDVLILFGGNDKIVPPQYSYQKYLKAKNRYHLDNVSFFYYPDREHFIYLSKQAANYHTKELSFPKIQPVDFEHFNYKLFYELNIEVLDKVVEFLLK